MKTSDFHYPLPEEYIAQKPVTPRDASRLMVYRRDTGAVSHRRFFELPDLLRQEDLLVMNTTRVIPARLYAKKVPTGGRVEILLLDQKEERIWEVMVGGKGLRRGITVQLAEGPVGKIRKVLEGPMRLIQFQEPIQAYLEDKGHVPLPPYIKEGLDDPEKYQTVYAEELGSSAAPTAGLHFTEELLERIRAKGIGIADVTLHIGLDTFAPVREQDPREHTIHTEWCRLSVDSAQKINAARAAGGRIISVGTTTARTLETAARDSSPPPGLQGFQGQTDLFILPGFKFQALDCLLTNFHLPESTLLMMVSAFTGRETILQLYETAKAEGYRFYSFGDAMLLM